MLESRVMFETRMRIYWRASDAAGTRYFANYFRLVEQAEEELFASRGANRQELLRQNKVWMPRVEAYSKNLRPIPSGVMIRVQLKPQFKGTKTIRYEFEMIEDASDEKF